jgi:hypothetical protein
MEQRPAYFNTLDVALISAGYDPSDVDQVLWESETPKLLRVRLKPNSKIVFVEITTASLVLEHKGPLTKPTTPDAGWQKDVRPPEGKDRPKGLPQKN